MHESNLSHHLFELSAELNSLLLLIQNEAELVLEIESTTDRTVHITRLPHRFRLASVEILHELLSLDVDLAHHASVFGLHKLVSLVHKV